MTARRPGPGRLTIGQAAAAAGTTASVIRAWGVRYGWPSPARSGADYRVFTEHEVEQIKWVRRQHQRGRDLGDILAQGRPVIPEADLQAIQAKPKALDFSDLSAPRTGEGYDTRHRLIAGLIQRHPGIVRWAIQQRARLHPADREPAVDGILRLAAEQLGNPGWLLEAMHA
jgi:hypothetical protein